MDSSNSSSNYYSHPTISFVENDSSPTTLFNYFPNSPNTHFEEYEPAHIRHLYNLYVLENSNHQSIYTPNNLQANNMTLDNNSSSNLETENPPVLPPETRPPGSKKDRHSKINTAQGPRDRRMRLSLDVARKFFDLQDMLGYDKASRTVDWLMKSSWAAIKDFKRGIAGNNSGSSISEEEVVSSEGLEDIISGSSSENLKKPDQSAPCQKKNSNKKGGKVVIARATVEKESRRKARERARDRTSQKKRLGFSSSVDAVEIIPNCTENNIQFQVDDGQVRRILRPVLVDGMDNSSIFYGDVAAQNDGIFQPQQFGEFQFCSKQWEY